MSRKVTLYAPKLGSKVEPKSSKRNTLTKKGDISSDCYLLHFSNIWLLKVTQKASRMVKENDTKNNSPFNACQPTN